MKFSFSPSSTDLEKVEEGTQLLLGDIKSEKELEIQVEFQENVPLTIARNGDHLHITCQPPRNSANCTEQKASLLRFSVLFYGDLTP